MTEIRKVHQCEYHRNGVGGEGFYAIVFDSTDDHGRTRRMLGIQFVDDLDATEYINPHTAIFDIGLLAECGVTFGQNSWRGDHYYPLLRDVITEQRAAQDRALGLQETAG